MQSPRAGTGALKPGVHKYPDPQHRDRVIYSLIANDGRCVGERGYLNEIDGDWIMIAAQMELAHINGLIASTLRMAACGALPVQPKPGRRLALVKT